MKDGYTIDELIEKLEGLKALHGNVEVTILQCTDEDALGDVEYWNAHICNIETIKDKNDKLIVSIY